MPNLSLRTGLRALGLLLGWSLVAGPAAAAPRATGAEAVQAALVEVARRATPAVVHIQVQRDQPPAPEIEELRAFYGLSTPAAPTPFVDVATGSGFVVGEDGRVMTNHHVVAGAVAIELVFSDQRRVPARLLVSDPRTDVAVLQIEAPGPYVALPFADSDGVEVGSWAVAVGNPFDFQSSVTVGVVSAKGRRGLSNREIQDYLQTDAAVNPGNSGGPLLDLQGRVIGINTAIYSQGADQNSGISFAIPANMARRIADALLTDGRVPRARIGVVADTAEQVGADSTRRGARIDRVLPGSPAERAGLRRGDVVVAVDGEPVAGHDALRDLVPARAVGEPMRLAIDRDGVALVVEVVPVDAPVLGVGMAPTGDAARWPWAGATFVDLTDAEKASLGVTATRGVLVARVEPGSAAASVGLHAGDVLIGIGGEAIDGVVELRRALSGRPAGVVVVRLERPGGTTRAILPISGRDAR